jgi:hypothetical protein
MPNRVAALIGSGLPPLAASSISGVVSSSLVATGSAQGTALALSTDYNIVSTVASSTGVILPAQGWNLGDDIIVANLGAFSLAVYPPVGAQIGVASINAALSVPAGKTALFIYVSATQWASLLGA